MLEIWTLEIIFCGFRRKFCKEIKNWNSIKSGYLIGKYLRVKLIVTFFLEKVLVKLWTHLAVHNGQFCSVSTVAECWVFRIFLNYLQNAGLSKIDQSGSLCARIPWSSQNSAKLKNLQLIWEFLAHFSQALNLEQLIRVQICRNQLKISK